MELRTLAANIVRIKDLCRRGNLTRQSMCSGIKTRQVSAGISAGKFQLESMIKSWNSMCHTAKGEDSEEFPLVADDCGIVVPRRAAGAHPDPSNYKCRT
jgi:hypothetical protein